MPAAEFDTLAAVRELRGAGIEHVQAEAIAQAVCRIVTEHAASKTDIAELRAETRADKATLRSKPETGIDKLRADIYRAFWVQSIGIVAVIGILILVAAVFQSVYVPLVVSVVSLFVCLVLAARWY